jgi:hypothetical protein
MDTLAHALWATATGKGVNFRSPRKIKLGWMALWGILPDLFAFTPVVLWMLWQLYYNGVAFSDIPRPELMSPEQRNEIFILRLSQTLYHMSHSFVVFLLFFFLGWIVRGYGLLQKGKANLLSSLSTGKGAHSSAPPWEMFGWFIHILMDIPTHTGLLYPTLFLWPLSGWYVDGNSWGTRWFMVTNYTLLLVVFLLLRFAGKKKDGLSS